MGKHLDFYKKCIEDKRMPDFGLCLCATRNLISEKILDRFEPSHKDMVIIQRQGLSSGYWGSGLSSEDHNRLFTFTPLRQTIVLFMAAINNEL